MKRLYILIYIIALVVSAKATAQQLQFDANAKLYPGQTASLSIVMDNDEAIRGFQFDLSLPSGLSPTISKVGETDHDITVSKVGESQWRVLSYSMENTEYAANYGAVVTMSIPVPEEYKVGNYTISASNAYLSAHNNSKITVADFSADLNVLQREIPAETVTLSQTELTLLLGQSAQITATVSPENTTAKTVSWTTSNQSVATVDANGKVTAVGLGTATITATCGEISTTCEVVVTSDAGVNVITNSSFNISVEGNELVIEGLPAEMLVRIFTLDGSLIYSGYDRRISLLSGNIYVIHYPGGTREIYLR